MKIEEAIEYMQDGVNAIHNECDTMLNNNSEIDDAFELIKEACEKQIAKKPIEGATFKHIGKCPDCRQVISTRSASNNCQYCGQKLDWGKDE